MTLLRLSTWVVSAALHAALLLAFSTVSGSTSFDAGSGDDLLKVEQGIALEGLMKLGEAVETIEAVEAPPVQQAMVEPPVERVEPDELSDVISSSSAPLEEAVAVREVTAPPVEQIRPEQIEQLEQIEQVAVLELKSSSKALEGGESKLLEAFHGNVYAKISRSAKGSPGRQRGTVVVGFTLRSDGTLVAREVTQSSGHKALDEAAVATLDRAAPFPPFPAGIDEQEMRLVVPFTFR